MESGWNCEGNRNGKKRIVEDEKWSVNSLSKCLRRERIIKDRVNEGLATELFDRSFINCAATEGPENGYDRVR